MFLVTVYRRIDDSVVEEDGLGQGAYQYKTFNNFVRYVIDNKKHSLYNIVRGSEYYIKVYKAEEQEEQEPELIFDGHYAIYS